jgi:hypothetical protein
MVALPTTRIKRILSWRQASHLRVTLLFIKLRSVQGVYVVPLIVPAFIMLIALRVSAESLEWTLNIVGFVLMMTIPFLLTPLRKVTGSLWIAVFVW